MLRAHLGHLAQLHSRLLAPRKLIPQMLEIAFVVQDAQRQLLSLGTFKTIAQQQRLYRRQMPPELGHLYRLGQTMLAGIDR